MELRSGFITDPALEKKQPIRSFRKEIIAVIKNYQRKNPQGMSMRLISRVLASRFKVSAAFAESLKNTLHRGIEASWIECIDNKYRLPRASASDAPVQVKETKPVAKVVHSVIAKAKAKASAVSVSKAKRADLFPEAYEAVLKHAQGLSWTPHYSKAIVLIGDAVPHEANDPQNKAKIDWREECGKLKGGNVKIYAVQCLQNANSTKFYADLAALTDGCHLELKEFRAITDMFLGVCYREAAEFQLQRHPEALAELGDGENARIMRPEALVQDGAKFSDAEMLAIHTAIHTGAASVTISGTVNPIAVGHSGCRFVRVHGVTFIEQNKEKDSRYARMAWEGRKITWMTRQGQWGLIMDGEVVRH